MKNLPEVQETRVPSLVAKVPWSREWLPIALFLPGESHGQRKPAGYTSWSRKGLYTTEWLTHTHTH